jgi:preprotein translocase subunit SecE
VADERDPHEGEQERPRTAAERRSRRSGAADSEDPTPSRGSTEGKGRATAVRDQRPKRASIFARIARFLREVVAELRKVIWPTRRQLVTYTIVVLVFVSFMVALVAGLDWLFVQGVTFLFGR